MAQGMLGLYSEDDEDNKQREQAYRAAQLTNPTQQNLYEIARGGQNMVEGARGMLGTGLSMATGQNVDLRSPGAQRRAAEQAAREEIAKLTEEPGSPEFYKAVMRVLQKNGLVDAAMEVAKQYQLATIGNRKADTADAAVGQRRDAAADATQQRRDAAADATQQRRDAAADATQQRRDAATVTAEVARERIARMGSNFVQALDQYEAALQAGDMPRAEALKKYLDSQSQMKGAGGVKLSPLGDRVEVIDAQGNTLRTIYKGEVPLTANQRLKKEQLDQKASDSLKRSSEQASRVLQFAAKAYGMVNVTTAGPLALSNAVPGSPAYDLSKMLESVAANVSFAELQAMRAASPTGGALGQVSDFENRLLQAVQGSLDQGQSPGQLRTALRGIADTAYGLLQNIEQHGGPAAPAKPTMGSAAPAPAAKPAAAQPAAPAATVGDKVRVIRKSDGKPGMISRGALEANRDKYTEQ